MKEIKWSNPALIREFCIRHKFYTCGTVEEYENLLFKKVGFFNTYLSNRRLENIAIDIYNHSNKDYLFECGITSQKGIMELLIRDNAVVIEFEY